MKKLLMILVLLFTVGAAWGQQGNTLTRRFAGVPSGTCSFPMLANDTTNSNLYFCDATSHWKLLGGGGGSGNLTATTPTANGVMYGEGTQALGVTAAGAADTIFMGNDSGTGSAPAFKAGPSGGTNGCAGATDTPTYNTSSHAWGCHQIAGGGVTGSGTTNTVPRFTSATAVGNSNITDTGSQVTVGMPMLVGRIYVGTGTTAGNAQIENNPTATSVQGVAATLVGIADAATGWRLAMDLAGNMGISGTAYFGTPLGSASLSAAVNTRTAVFNDPAPAVGDDGLFVILNPATAIHLTRISCGVTGTTSVVVNLVKGAASLISDLTATAGDVNTVVVTTWANGSAQCGGTSSCAVAAHAPVKVHVGTIVGTPTNLACAVDYTVD